MGIAIELAVGDGLCLVKSKPRERCTREAQAQSLQRRSARYRLSHAELDDDFTDVPDSAITTQGFRSRFRLEAMLHQLSLSANYNHAGGFFSQFQALWNSQSNQGYDPDRPGDHFWQLNVSAGYRFSRRHAELTIGVLNLTDRDYRLNPLTFYNELPRERTFVARLQFNF